MTTFGVAPILVTVALMVSSASYADGGEAQLRMENEVRRLLRRAYAPLALSSLPLAQALCEVTGISNSQSALQHVVANAFQGNWQESRLKDLLLPSDPKDRMPRGDTAHRLQISKRHLQRRRARAVSILAFHIRKLVGAPYIATTDDPGPNAGDQDRAADPLETIAELVSNIEPSTAANIFRLSGPHSRSRAGMLSIRGCVDMGDEIKPVGNEFERYSFSPLVAILKAQSKQVNGKPAEAEQELWPLFARASRDILKNSEVQFELEWLWFLRARHCGDAREMDRVATNLKRIAKDVSAWLLRALLAQAEARIRCGQLQDAITLLDEVNRRGLREFALRQLASSSLLKAELALEQGDDATAERLASGAYLILRGRHYDAYRAQTSIARARLRLHAPWTCPDDLGNLPGSAWDRVGVNIECARRLNADGRTEHAREYAKEAFSTAVTLKYEGLAARAAATLGSTFDKASTRRRDWHLRALSHLLTTRDRAVACDLFVLENDRIDATPFPPFDEAVAKLLYEGLQDAIPHLRTESETERSVARAFLKHLTAFVLGITPFSDELTEAVEALDAEAGWFGQYLVYFQDDASHILETVFAAIVSLRQRSELDQRLTVALRKLVSAVRPRADLRRFLVG